MRTVLSYLLTPVQEIVIALLLLIFHPVQMVCRGVGGYPLRKKAVDLLNFMLLYSQVIIGARIRFRGLEHIPRQGPFIIVSNHQSMMDIPPIIWVFRKFHPRFVSKKELGRGIPSISYNLKHGGSVLIDRGNGRQALAEIARLGRRIEAERRCASIFPEGTRSKTGKMKPFQHPGIAALLRSAPSAVVVPFVIDGNSEMMKNGYFPLRFGTCLTYTVLPPINAVGRDPKEVTSEAERQIRAALGQTEG